MSAERVAAVLAEHRLHDRRSDPRYPWCICGWVPERDTESAYSANLDHVAAIVAAALDDGLSEAALCSQCGELPSVMVKIGSTDGWCTDCLDLAAATPDAGIRALKNAADEMSALILGGDIAEVAAPVEGEVGRASAVERRDRLYEEPDVWLREYAAILAAQPTARADQ